MHKSRNITADSPFSSQLTQGLGDKLFRTYTDLAPGREHANKAKLSAQTIAKTGDIARLINVYTCVCSTDNGIDAS